MGDDHPTWMKVCDVIAAVLGLSALLYAVVTNV